MLCFCILQVQNRNIWNLSTNFSNCKCHRFYYVKDFRNGCITSLQSVETAVKQEYSNVPALHLLLLLTNGKKMENKDDCLAECHVMQSHTRLPLWSSGQSSWVWNQLSLKSITEELLKWKSSGSGSRIPRLTMVGICCADHVTHSICKSWH
jgi:hypothetical protein